MQGKKFHLIGSPVAKMRGDDHRVGIAAHFFHHARQERPGRRIDLGVFPMVNFDGHGHKTIGAGIMPAVIGKRLCEIVFHRLSHDKDERQDGSGISGTDLGPGRAGRPMRDMEIGKAVRDRMVEFKDGQVFQSAPRGLRKRGAGLKADQAIILAKLLAQG